MTYCSDTVTKGNIYQIIRDGNPVNTCHGIIDKITENGHLHMSFSSVVKIKENDILKNEDNQIFYVIYTAFSTEHQKNDKQLVICQTEASQTKSKKNQIILWLPIVVSIVSLFRPEIEKIIQFVIELFKK